ncbi:type II toxin-antitoxin system Phd/YefM family antitoxin [Rhodohalobacter sp. SW132]|uniref:type II toxin-antitoxin system Phd/YefM family antitoxin n=1 Tax=Rhodohalobacter sp. SW132 TaxID=2293433 RepID=UPI00131560AD|nr:type II toxin-antitoxin system prevent-host-death family antitoxin [Rhodohalobacter sp. SW132]
MKKVKVNEVREHLADYLSDAEKGEEIIITKHSRPIARLVPLKPSSTVFPDLSDHRKSVAIKNKSVSETIIDQRKEERY